MIEPFGYFRAEPFGWTDCSEADEGAVPLYELAAITDLENQLSEAELKATNLRQQLAHMTDDAFGLRVMLREANKQRDELLAALQSISNITGDAGFNIGGPLEHCPGELEHAEAKRFLSLACEYLKDVSKAAFSAIATNAALEQAASVCESIGTNAHGIGRDDSEAFDCADAIRALKVPE